MRRLPLLLLSSLLASQFSVISNGWATNSCEDLFGLTIDQLGQPRADYMAKFHPVLEHPAPFSPITDQSHWGDCWECAQKGKLETDIFEHTGERIQIDHTYNNEIIDLQRAMAALESVGEGFEQGGFPPAMRTAIDEEGMIPVGAKFPKVQKVGGKYVQSVDKDGNPEYIKWPNYQYDDPKVAGSFATQIQYTIDNYNVRFQTALQEGKPEKATAIQQQSAKKMLELFDFWFGAPPAIFEYNGEIYTPASFRDKYLPPKDYEQVLHTIPSKPLPKRFKQELTGGGQAFEKAIAQAGFIHEIPSFDATKIHTRRSSLKKINEALLANFNQPEKMRKAIPMIFTVEGQFVDNKSGLMSVEAFPWPKGIPVPRRSYRETFGPLGGGHAEVIVDVITSPENGKTYWVLKNSWGEQTGQNGLYFMDMSYAEKFVMGVFIDEPKPPKAKKSEKVKKTGLSYQIVSE